MQPMVLFLYLRSFSPCNMFSMVEETTLPSIPHALFFYTLPLTTRTTSFNILIHTLPKAMFTAVAREEEVSR